MSNDDAATSRIYIKDMPEAGADDEGSRFTPKSQN